jgi:hypothetical protein
MKLLIPIKDKGLKELAKLCDKFDDIEKKSGYRYLWTSGHRYLENVKTNERICIDSEFERLSKERASPQTGLEQSERDKK